MTDFIILASVLGAYCVATTFGFDELASPDLAERFVIALPQAE